jgi:endonuclease YncB( thermonuclease family)
MLIYQWILITLVFTLVSFSDVFHPHFVETKCEEVIDGDSIKVVLNQDIESVRLKFIDAPELGQKFIGELSKDILKKKIEGQKVRLLLYGKGYYGRWLAEVYKEKENINLFQVSRGHASLYKFSQFTSLNKKFEYYFAFRRARIKKLGMWKFRNLVNPYHFRKKNRPSK